MGNINKEEKEKKEVKLNVKEEISLTETLKGFVSEDKIEKSQEEEIIEYKEKKKKISEKNLTEEEIKKLKEKELEDEEELKKIKEELLKSLRVRIPAIEKKFFQPEPINKKGKEQFKIKEKELNDIENVKEQDKNKIDITDVEKEDRE